MIDVVSTTEMLTTTASALLGLRSRWKASSLTSAMKLALLLLEYRRNLAVLNLIDWKKHPKMFETT